MPVQNQNEKPRHGSGRPVRTRHFMLMEVVIAIGTFALVLSGIYAGLRLTERTQAHYLLEDKALEVLDNSVERLAAEPRPDAARALAVLREEFDRSGLAAGKKATLACATTARGLDVTLRTRGGHRLAGLILPGTATGGNRFTREKP